MNLKVTNFSSFSNDYAAKNELETINLKRNNFSWCSDWLEIDELLIGKVGKEDG